jgi:molybdenum cofactor guanylyltransferase
VPSTSGVILAGGQGSRLGGVNKALLQIGDCSNIDRVLAALRPICAELIVVANDRSLSGLPDLRVILDERPHAGVLPALAGGLAAASGELVIVVACDMPFLSGPLLAEQLRRSADSDVVMPIVEGRPQPMHAVYRRATSLAAIRAALAAGEQRMISFLDRVRVAYVDEAELRPHDRELLSFFNTNTPADLERARYLAGARPDPGSTPA